MDPDVVKSLARWPNVPAAYGWLSLTPRGLWRFHAGGLAAEGGAGDQISNERITAFINRNFEHDDAGNWFFQNGPQRAYVRIDAAPLVLRYGPDNDALVTHTGQPCGTVSNWWLDETGRVFATTEAGPCVVDDRELMRVLDDLVADNELDLLDAMSALEPGQSIQVVHRLAPQGSPLTRINSQEIADTLGFVSCPVPPPPTTHPTAA